MFDHVTIRVADYEASLRFYETVLGAVGIERAPDPGGPEWGDFSLVQAGPDHPPTRALHVGFAVPSREHVDRFWRAGVDAGYEDDGAPGPRPEYTPDYYGGFLRDPDGNSVEAVTSAKDLRAGVIDHLWLRSPDLDAQKRFYTTIAEFAGIGLGDDEPDRKQFLANPGSFSFVTGGPATRNVHIAFSAPTNAVVDAFHAAATRAGYEDNGAPGERAVYHPGYYGAFVLDPDGHNVEAVNHNR